MRILAIDQGTTSTRALLREPDGRLIPLLALPHRQIYPHSGWVEHDPQELLTSIDRCLDAAMAAGGVAAVGLDNQGESCLPHSTGALKLMQRIRDEAHRFANGYNELLYRKRMRESALDDAPGMSAAKKSMLLEKFKSVAAIKRADPASIAAIRGISETWARNLLNYLNSSSNS